MEFDKTFFKVICIKDYSTGYLHPDDTFDHYEVKKGWIYDAQNLYDDTSYRYSINECKIYYNGIYCGVHQLSLFKTITEHREDQINKLEL